MLKISKQKKTSFSSLSIDISGSSIGVAISTTGKNCVNQVLWSKRKSFHLQEKESNDNPSLAISKTLNDILKEALKANQKSKTLQKQDSPKKITISFGVPWYVAETRSVNYSFDGYHEITQRYIDSVVEVLEKDFKASAFQILPKPFRDDDLSLMKKQVLEISLNGYNTSKPVGKSASSFSCSVFFSAVPVKLEKVVSKTLGQYFNTTDVTYISHPSALYSALSDVIKKIKNTLIINIGGEYTEIVVTNDGIIEFTKAFPVGEKDIIRLIENKLSVGTETARSLLSISQKGEARNEEMDKLEEHKEEILSSWIDGFKKIEKDIREAGLWVTGTVLMSHDKSSDYFYKEIKSTLENETGLTDGSFLINITDEYISSRVKFNPSLSFDPFLSVMTLLY